MSTTSGTAPYRFSYLPDLHALPPETQADEIKLHGTFADDRRPGQGQAYYGIEGQGLIRIDPDMRQQTRIVLPEPLQSLNIHSMRLVTLKGEQRLVMTANDGELVAFVTLDGTLDFSLGRPDLEAYQDPEVPYKPTDTLLIGDTLYVADGYGAQYVSLFNVETRQWTGLFGGKSDEAVDGLFGTAHGINTTYDGKHLLIADRPHARLQVHTFDGDFVKSYSLPAGAWPCFVDYIEWKGRTLAVIASLFNPDREHPAPIYIVDAETFEVISTVRPKEELAVEAAQHMHNVAWHIHDDQLYLLCQSWNPGFYFVLKCID